MPRRSERSGTGGTQSTEAEDVAWRANTIELPISPTEDEIITCIYCRREKPCEYAVSVLRQGETALMGVHRECIEPLRRRNPRLSRSDPQPDLCPCGKWKGGNCPECNAKASTWMVRLGEIEGLLRRALWNGGNLHAGHEPMCPVAPGAKIVNGVTLMGTSKNFDECSCWVREACGVLGMNGPCDDSQRRERAQPPEFPPSWEREIPIVNEEKGKAK